jgi:metal transporter CNNM
MRTTTIVSLSVSIAHRVLAAPYFSIYEDHSHKGEPVGSATFWWKMIISAALVLSGGAFAGYVYYKAYF